MICLFLFFGSAQLPKFFPKVGEDCNGEDRCEYSADKSTTTFETLKITETTFVDYSSVTGILYDDGGAIHSQDYIVEIMRCHFHECKANRGGAIYVILGNVGDTTDKTKAYIKIVGSDFTSCKSLEKGGGACFLHGSVNNRPITVSGCTFIQNYSPETQYYDGHQKNLPKFHSIGGALTLSTQEAVVEGCRFEGNGQYFGSCIVFQPFLSNESCTLTISNSVFLQGNSNCNQEMIVIYEGQGDISISSCKFIGTYLESVIESFAKVKISNTCFSPGLEIHRSDRAANFDLAESVNHETCVDDYDLDSSTPTENPPFIEPTDSEIGDLSTPTENPPFIEPSNSEIEDPIPEGFTEFPGTCGAPYFGENQDNRVQYYISKCTFQNLDSQAVSLINAGVYCYQSKFINCKPTKSTIDGGGFKISCSGDLSIDKFTIKFDECIFKDCSAQSGGGLYISVTKSTYILEVHKCTFENNQATYKSSSETKSGQGGGGLNIRCKQGIISSCTFINNYGVGGSLLLYLDNPKTNENTLIDKCDFMVHYDPNKDTPSSFYIFDTAGLGSGATLTISSCKFDGELGEKSYQIDELGRAKYKYIILKDVFFCTGKDNAFQGGMLQTHVISDENVFYSCVETETPITSSESDLDPTPQDPHTHTEEPPTKEPHTEEPHTEEPHTEEPPTKEPHTEEPPTKEPPTKEPHTEEPPTKKPHTEEPHTEEPPTKEPHTEEPPTKEPPTKEPHTEEPPTKKPHTEEPHTEEPPTKEPHTEEPPTKEPHTEEPPTKEPPTKEPHTEEPPTKEPHTEEPPTKEPHTEEPPTKEPHTEEPPTKEPHTEEPPTKEPHTEEPPTKEPPTKEPHTEEPPTKEPHTEEQPTPDIVTEQPIDYVCESGKRCSFPPGTLSTTTTITIVKSLFEEISNTDDNIDDGNGGAIYLVNYDVICMNNTFAKCTCINHGGAMYIEVSLPESAKQINAQISQSNFSKNKAHSGSAIYIKSGHKSRSFSLHGNRFESNEITSSSSFSTILEESSSPVGGCVFIDGFGGTISNLVFSGNKGKGADLTILLSHDIEDSASTEIHECNFNFVGNKDSSSSVYVIMNVDGPINLQFINCSFNGTLTEDSHFFEVDKSVNKQGKIFLNDVYLCDFTDISAFGENYTDYIDNNSVIYYTCDNLPTWNPDPNPGGNTEEGLSTGAKVAIGIIVPIVIIAVIIVIVIFVFKKNNTENVENPTSELSETANGSSSDFMYSMNSQDNPMYVGNPLSTNIIDEENDPFKHEIEDSSSSNQLV